MFLRKSLSIVACALLTAGVVHSQSALLQVEGMTANDQLSAVTALSDLDGDLIPELAIGVPKDDTQGVDAGAVRIVSGRDGSPLTTLYGLNPDDRFGFRVEAIGDVNQDGKIDFAVSAFTASYSLVPYAGYVSMRSGAAPFGELWKAWGFANTRLGFSLTAAGDVNGDGVPDVAMGGPIRLSNSGLVRVRSGSTGAHLMGRSGAPNSWYGFSVAGIGDINQDGFDDVLVSAPNPLGTAASAYCEILLGPSGNLLGATLTSSQSNFARSVAGAGDIDFDGVPDYALGIPDGSSVPNGGRVQIRSGATHGVLETIFGAANERLGNGLLGGGDYDGDGQSDLLISAPSLANAGTPNGGRVLIRYRATGQVLPAVDGNQSNASFGDRVAHADLDLDGRDDLLVGSPNYNTAGGLNAGRVEAFTLAEYPASGGDLRLLTAVNSPLNAQAIKTARGGDVFALRVYSPKGTAAGDALFLAMQSFPTGLLNPGLRASPSSITIGLFRPVPCCSAGSQAARLVCHRFPAADWNSCSLCPMD